MKEQNVLYSPPEKAQENSPVLCLGMTFENDTARREYFTEELRKKLQDPEFRKIEGFPLGEDENILALSDPPYYCACPNPWLADFIEEWESQKPEKPTDYKYHREPFAADVSEGKNDPIYNAHSYHTKVPHKAIMRYILHYTEPGDIVFDGFCGTGMTGVAAQMCGDRDVVLSLGYQVKDDGTILQEETDKEGKKAWKVFSKLGARKAVLNDLSPAATFIAYNYNTPVDVKAFEKEAKRILKEVEDQCGWMYETLHTDGITKGKINYTVWSDVFVCPECAKEVVFWEAAVDKEAGKVKDIFPCPHCSAELTKRNMERAWNNIYDTALGTAIRQAKQVPVLINYSVGTKRHEKIPTAEDLALVEKIENMDIPHWFPTATIPKGDKTNEPINIGTTNVHLFYTRRNLKCLAKVYELVKFSHHSFIFTGFIGASSKLNQIHLKNYVFGGGGCNPGPRKGVIYTPSISLENSITKIFEERLKTQMRAFTSYKHLIGNSFSLSTSSATDINNNFDNSIDYVFIDPPFGSNLMYSELNYTLESWNKIFTNNTDEAIENKTQKKSSSEYRVLMAKSFEMIYRLLKPGRWITVEFSNTKAQVWNNIQSAISGAGFIIGNVSSLDKKQGGLNAIVGTTAVKQDLVISAYKPNGGFEERFEQKFQSEEGVWEFIRTHLGYLPVTKKQDNVLVAIPERDPRLLYDQVIAYYVRKGYNVPIDSQDFQNGLSQRFAERDGMYFLSEQVAEYDRKKMLSGLAVQESLFVSDEASAIAWLRKLLREKPQSFQDINPLFMKELSGWKKNEKGLELSTLLEQNFLMYDGTGLVPEQIHAYLSTNWKDMRNLPKDDPALIAKAKGRWYLPDPNKAGDLEKLREKALLKEFEEYKEAKKKLKIFRLEAVRAGFKKAWQERDYSIIIAVAEKIPSNILEEDPKLLMWYDQAVTRVGDA